MTIGYVTDLEGDFERWRRYVELSKVLRRNASGEIELREGARFVYGGDAVDWYPGDLQILEELVGLKRRYPDRVRLIIGNRDANKLRLNVELSAEHAAAHPLRTHPGPFWQKDAKPVLKLTKKELDANSLPGRLKWILAHTMGAPKAFEARREELSRLGGEADVEGGARVGDDEVVRSYLESVRPGGALFEYLRVAELAALVDGTLFVHAGLPRRGLEWVPGWTPFAEGLPLPAWLEALDKLRQDALAEVEALSAGDAFGTDAWSIQGGYGHPQPGTNLCQYGMRDMPDGARQPSVVYNGHLDDDYEPLQPDDATLAWLREGGVRRVVSGHLPHGDAPLILRFAEGIDAISADTAYGPLTLWEAEDGEWREGGEKAVSEVLLAPGAGESRVHGVLSNGKAFEGRLDDAALGRVYPEGWRAKGRVDGQLLLSHNKGWTFKSRLAKDGEELQCA